MQLRKAIAVLLTRSVAASLALGAQAPNYSVNVFRVAMRYRF